MKITRKVLIAAIGLTGLSLMSFGTYAAAGHHFKMHQPRHNEAATEFGSGKNTKFLPFNFEKTTTQVDLNEVDKTALKGEKRGKRNPKQGSGENLEFHGGTLGFLWNFLDDSNLTDAQKKEIQSLQANKQKAMGELLKQMTSTTGDKTDIENKMKEINDKFLESLKAYIPEDKATEYSEFISELPEWNMKAEKKKGERGNGERKMKEKKEIPVVQN